MTFAITESTTTVGVVALGVVALEVTATKVGVAAPTTTLGVTAVAEAEEARLGLLVARDVAKGAAWDEATGVVAAALREATLDGGTAREVVQLGMSPVSYTHLTLPTICSV